MMRIAVAGWQHETNTFSPHKTTLEDFCQPDSWPALSCGNEILEKFQQLNIPISGFIQEAKQRGHDIVPLQWCSAIPSGKVVQVAFDKLLQQLLNKLQQHSVDAVYLDLHGAMVTENDDDADGEIIHAVRRVVGDAVPIVVSLDLHANITPAMLHGANLIIAYRTYPHVDMAATGALLAKHLVDASHYHVCYQHLPFLIPLTSQCTLTEPVSGLYQLLAELEQQYSVVLSYTQGFPLADTYHTGPCVFGYGRNVEQVQKAIDVLSQTIMSRQSAFRGHYYTPEDAIAHVQSLLPTITKPFLFADTQDNPGCGGAGNTTGILSELLSQGVSNALVAMIHDPVVAALCHSTGEGNWLTANLGAEQIAVTGQVKVLADGNFVATGPFYQGCRMQLGPMALLQVDGVDIIIAHKNVQAADQAMLRHLLVDIADKTIIVLKSSVHFRADFEHLAADVLVVTSPGLNIADLKMLQLHKIRPGVEKL